MTKDQQQTLLTCKFSDIPDLFPGYDFEFLKRKRKALQKAKAQRYYRKRNHVSCSTDVNIFHDDRLWRRMCVRASRKYTQALMRLA